MLINAVSSGATGVGLLVASKAVASVFGINQTVPFAGVGVFLIVFATMVYFVSRQNPMNLNFVRLIIAGDLLWVAVSTVIVLFQSFNLSVVGYLLVGAVGIWVAVMAYLQSRGVNKLFKTS
jgi:hypothetical protein